ncbi:hypothetical protein HG536_0B05970 [Torulaspora globosa]|uniref:ATP-dependent DNA helicase CHL1 n=1 Tax=Torulaspora globosa TaxID=48254 RepID=A0A7G3ZDZ5_9SACH|nr:uncharacterized protein HG536_0B05970 [Torulaspora globosa]QLL31731.1 hypothetical protein HG536_0B05970 [Torulaspora globosa]
MGAQEGCEKFGHPYEPYEIQLQLMRCIYDALSSGRKVAVVESPTGTGKTLSLICSVVSWLRRNKPDLLAGAFGEDAEEEDDDEPDWVNETYKRSVLGSRLQAMREYEQHLERLSRDLRMLVPEVRETAGNTYKRRKTPSRVEVSVAESDFLAQPYESDSENANNDGGVIHAGDKQKLEREVKEMLAKLESSRSDEKSSLKNDNFNPVKIFYASRTHSQLNQFASQLRLPKFESSFVEQQVPVERLKYVPLASRKQLCINEDVKKWGSVEAINDACAELLKSPKGCQFYQPSSAFYKEHLSRSFRDNTFAQIQDIEDLCALGKALHVCPYYATRDSLTGAEVVTLPYQYLLSESTRMQLGIDLKDSIVIIDEAHNLVETINAIHSAEISLADLTLCNEGVKRYLERFRSRLNPGNRVNLMKLMELMRTWIAFIRNNYKKPGQEISFVDFFASTNIDTLNIHKINRYITKSKVAYKIDTYTKSLSEESCNSDSSSKAPVKASSNPLLFKVANFLQCLTNPAKEGRFFFEKGQVIKYMLLEPAESFQSIVNDARCVILAGGTMQPVSDLLNNLFMEIPKEEISLFSCNHVIPDENLRAYIPQESQFEFTFEKRQSLSLIKGGLFQFYLALAKNVPTSGGIVGFFPSYQYLEYVYNIWKREGLFTKLDNVRKIFYESKVNEDPLPAYTEAVSKGKGALLLAVVGGKLSEGINFQDDLCRAVVMTGLPFPNVFSGELLIKTRHLENKIISSGGTTKDAKQATRDFYETICMKAVNQSIGRAIRHANDYSLIFLLDKRYANPEISKKLSQWVSRRLQSQSTVTEIMKDTSSFFSLHNHR